MQGSLNWWRSVAAQAEQLARAAADDPSDQATHQALRRLSSDMAAATPAGIALAATPADELDAAADAHLACGEAWFAAIHGQQALQAFETALALQASGGLAPANDSRRRRTDLGLARALVDQGRAGEALPRLESVIAGCGTEDASLAEVEQARLAQAWHTLALVRGAQGNPELELRANQAAVEARRQLTRMDVAVHELDLSRSLASLSSALARVGRVDEAFAARAEATDCLRTAWRRRPTVASGSLLTQSLARVSELHRDVGRWGEALETTFERVAVYRELAALNREDLLFGLAGSLNSLGIRLNAVGRKAEALTAIEEAVEICRELTGREPRLFSPALARNLNNLTNALGGVGRRAEALAAVREAVEICRERISRQREVFGAILAGSLNNLGIQLSMAGDHAESLAAAEQSVDLYRDLAARQPKDFQSEFARSAHNLSIRLSDVSRRAEALAAAAEAVQVRRELFARNRMACLPDLARSLDNLGNRLSDVGRHIEALAASEEAVDLYRELVALHSEAFEADLSRALNNLGCRYSRMGRKLEALAANEQAIKIRRKYFANDPVSTAPDMACSLCNQGERLREVGRHAEALATTNVALDLYRDLVLRYGVAHLPDLARSIGNQAVSLADLDRHADALIAWRECGATLLAMRPGQLHQWTRMAADASSHLDTPTDLRDFHLVLLEQLVDHRELAWDSDHAALFLQLQGRVASRVWALLRTLPPTEGELLDRAVTVLASVLQSPDLSRFITAQSASDGAMAELARLKTAVIEAEQRLQSLRGRSSPGDGGGGLRMFDSARSSHDPRNAYAALEAQAEVARAAREAFRAERSRLARADARFASAFELPSVAALRSALRVGDAQALLCLLELPADDDGDGDEPVTVGAMIHADGRPTQLLDLPGLREVAWSAGFHEPGTHLAKRLGAMRGAAQPMRQDGEAPRTEGPPITEDLRRLMNEALLTPLRQALAGGGSTPVQRLHVCPHGLLQQLPLPLLEGPPDASAGDDEGQLQWLGWPGLPYLRLASATAAEAAAPPPSTPWLVGHDCAWDSPQPLPMVAVEAALLRRMLLEHGQTVQRIEQAAQISAGAAGLVTCCHGGRGIDSRFDSALHLGSQPLQVRQIVAQRLAPPLALLPACHAGETVDDEAGNALGVAAGFLLGGSRVVVASSKAVSDLLAPWYSTLVLWHVLHGHAAHEAARQARSQFARLAFPEDYRAWLQRALPQALATIQPGGEEDRFINAAPARAARAAVASHWPWQGQAQHLFAGDKAMREEAAASLAQGVLQPRPDIAASLAQDLQEAAAFVFVYGVA